jgi:hypothetical protein
VAVGEQAAFLTSARCAEGHRSGCHLSNTLGDQVVTEPKRTLLPILTVLFLISYGLLTTLVVEQSRTIDSQRGLIRDLFQDSVQLSALKGKTVLKHNAEAQAQAQAKSRSQTNAPTAQAPPHTDTQKPNTGKHRRPLPQKPPRDASGEGDERRMLISI